MITSHTSDTKTLLTSAGPVRATCDVLLLPDCDMRLVTYSCRPGGDDDERLQAAVAVGQQLVPG